MGAEADQNGPWVAVSHIKPPETCGTDTHLISHQLQSPSTGGRSENKKAVSPEREAPEAVEPTVSSTTRALKICAVFAAVGPLLTGMALFPELTQFYPPVGDLFATFTENSTAGDDAEPPPSAGASEHRRDTAKEDQSETAHGERDGHERGVKRQPDNREVVAGERERDATERAAKGDINATQKADSRGHEGEPTAEPPASVDASMNRPSHRGRRRYRSLGLPQPDHFRSGRETGMYRRGYAVDMSDLGDFTEFDSDDGGGADEAGADSPDSGDVDTDTSDHDGGDPAVADDFERYEATPAGRDRGVGVLSAAEGLRIAEDEAETRLRAYVTADNRSGVRVGSYLLAPYPDDERLFCRVSALEYAQEYRADDATEIHARRAMRSAGVDEEDFKLMATLDPVAVLYEDDGALRRRMTDRVPKPESVVHEAEDKAEIKTGLKIPAEGVFLGHLAVGGETVRTAAEPPTIDYRLKDDYDSGDPLVFRHTLVAGGTGSGKTHAAKNMLRQYLGDRSYPVETGADREVAPAVVQFDPQDEYAQMRHDGEYPEDFARRLDRESVTHGGHEDTVVFVPQVGSATYSASGHRAEEVRFTVPFSMVYTNPWLIAGSGLNDNQYGALTNVLLPRFRDERGREGTYQQFMTFLDDPGLREDLDESGRVHEATFDAVARRARGFGNVFDQDARPVTERVHELVRAGGLTVVPTYHITSSRDTETVVLALASLLVDQKLSNDPRYDRIKETPLVVGMDEAHSFLTDADSVQARKVIGKFTEAAKQGRKERLGLFLVTQDPQDIADPVFKQVNTTAVLNLGDEDAISAVNIPSNLESKVPYMEKGQMVVYSPDNSEPVELVGLPHCVTRHGRG